MPLLEDETLLRLTNELAELALREVREDEWLFMPVNRLHGSLEETGHEAGHVAHAAVNEELFDYFLARKHVEKPN